MSRLETHIFEEINLINNSKLKLFSKNRLTNIIEFNYEKC